MPTIDGKSEKFELFEDLFQTSLKINNQLTEEDKINYCHCLMRGDALQTFKNITSPNRENLGEILNVFRRKYVKPQSMATAKHKFQRLIFNPANQNLIDFLDELQKLAKDAFGVEAQAIIEQFIYAKMPPHLRKPINQAHLENGTYEQIVSHLKRELELNGLEAPDEIPINTVTQQAPQQNSNKPRKTCHLCKKPGHSQNQCRQLKRVKDQTRNNTNSDDNNNNGIVQTNSNPNSKIANNTKENTVKTEKVCPRGIWLKIFLPLHNLKCPFTPKNFWQSTWHFSSSHTFCGKQQSQQLSWQTTSQSPAFSKQRQSHQHSGTHVIMCCNSTLK